MVLTEQQNAGIRSAAAALQPELRQQFLNSVQDDLLGIAGGRTVTDLDVARAVNGVTWAMTEAMANDDD
jgi:hypothetical protein